MPTKTFDMPWNLLVKSSIRDVEMQPKCPDIINNVVSVVEKLPDFQMKIARQLRSLVNKASGKNPIPYLHMLFPVLFKGLRQNDFIENVLKNILEILIPVINHKNPDMIRVRQKILLEIDKLGPSFIRKNSKISSCTVSRLRKKKKK